MLVFHAADEATCFWESVGYQPHERIDRFILRDSGQPNPTRRCRPVRRSSRGEPVVDRTQGILDK